ncbi:hypothetical protein diail_9824 [Diaporthe ilicicola]|nr:hypothetical protein diail_9824 [Diaporthe ilicicola]
MAVTNSSRCDDFNFRPVLGCRGDFDFSLIFEHTILSLAPSSIFLLLASVRLFSLLQRKKRVAAGRAFQLFKLGAVACYAAIQIALLVAWTRPGAYGTRASLAAAVLSLLDVLALAALSWLEHSHSLRPSTLINVYLLVSLVFDAVQIRTLWLIDESNPANVLPAEFSAALVIKTSILFLEAVEKRKFLPSEWTSRSPEETAGVFSRSLLIWLRGILAKGRTTLLSPTDLDPLREGLGTARLSRSFQAIWQGSVDETHVSSSSATSAPSPKLLLVLVRTLKWSMLTPVIPRLVQTAFTLCQPLLLREFLRYLDGYQTFVGSTGYGFIIVYGLVYLGLAISGCIYWRLTYKCLVQMRGCLVAAVFEKTTSIDPSQYDMTAPVSLVSTDMERIIAGCKDVHEVWANAVQVAIAIWLLYLELGIACVAPAAVATVSSLGSMLMSSYADKTQVSWMEATQERVGATAKAIAGMRSIKLLGLSDAVFTLLQKLRNSELHAARHFRYIEVLTATISFMPLLISPVFTFMVFVLQAQHSGSRLDTVSAFTSLALLNLMTQPLVWLFQAVPLLMASLGCLKRVESYLHAPKKNRQLMVAARPGEKSSSSGKSVDEGLAVRNGQFAWDITKPILTEVNIDAPTNRLTIIIGPVGSGKSTLAKALIGELPHSSGDISLGAVASTEVAFCDQDSFIMSGTLLDNIVGFSNFDSNWLDSVIRAVDLDRDISALPQGMATQVGSKGTNLSGGQRQRVAVARAIYARKEIAIFDDVLSGLDPTTKERVFEQALGPEGLLRKMGCSVILCTHDVSLLPRADHVIVLGNDGKVADAGTFPVLSAKSAYIQSLVIRTKAENSSGISKEESLPDGDIGNEGGQTLPPLGDSTTEPPDDLTRRLGDASIYKYLAGHIGLWRVLTFILITCGWAVFSTIGSIWLKYWSSADSSSNASNAYYLGVYAVFQGLALLFLALFSGFTLTILAVKAGRSLHHVLLKTMVWAPLSFFSTVDIGITTNRFSQDIILVDGDMPMSLLETLSAGLVAVIQMIYIAVAAPYVAIAYPFLIACLYLVQSFYLRTSRQLRFLDLEARSPLYTQILDTIQGLPTIRSFGWVGAAIERNYDLVDTSQRPVYLLYMVQRWLQLVLELIIAVMAILLVAVALALQSSSGGYLGVALTQLMSLSQELKMIVINYTNLETSLTAISRMRSFEKGTPTENLRPEGYTDPPPQWPLTGRIQLDKVTATYASPGVQKAPSFALRDISLEIPSGQKVAICGRSGSGKSTLIAALTSMVGLYSGSIHIDGLDLSHIRPSAVRAALNVIPQEPFFFHKNVALNIEPSRQRSREALRSALEKVRMWDFVEANGGVDADLDLDNLSQGQKQLLALARAILKDSNIVLLDEATSSVDQHTAGMIMDIVREEFRGRTIIAVAHQLNTIVDFDLVVVMDSGRVAEVGNPRQLLETKSIFRELWDSHGP